MVPEMEESVNILFGNIRGIIPLSRNKTKLNYLTDICQVHSNDILILTESHLSEKVKDCEIKINDYDIHRCDRNGRSHGGVLVYTRSKLKATNILEYNSNQCEMIIVWVKSLKTLIVNIYRPPNSGDPESFYQCLEAAQEQINKFGKTCEQYIVCGDFNFPHIEWPYGNLPNRDTTRDKEKKQATLLLDFMDINSFSNIITSPTRQRNIIDLMMVNNSDRFNVSDTIVNKVISDHNIMSIDMKAKYNMNQSYVKCNPYINSIFEYDIEIGDDSDEWSQFYNDILDEAMSWDNIADDDPNSQI